MKKIISEIKIIAVVLIITVFIMLSNLIKPKMNNTDISMKEKTKITFLSSWGGIDSKSKEVKDILEQFQKLNPDILVENRSRSNDDFLFTLKTDFAQGNDPDVFGLWPGSDINLLIQAGKVADLSNILDKDNRWKDSFDNKAWCYDTYNEKIFGLPVEIIYEGLFINVDLFNKYNIKIPENYNEFKDTISKFKKVNIIPVAYNSTPEGTFLYQNLVMTLGGKENVENPVQSGKIKKCYIDAMKEMKALYEMGAFPQDSFTIDDKTRNDLFINKKAAMIVQGSWFYGSNTIDPNNKTVKLIPFPYMEDNKNSKVSVIYGLGNGNFHMSEQAYENPKVKEASVKLLKFLTQKENVSILLKDSGSISNICLSDNPYDKRVNNNDGVNIISRADSLIGPPDSFITRTFWEEVLVKKFPQMLEGKILPEDIFNGME